MKELTVTQLKAKMDAKEPFQLVDIRETWEVTVANIGGIHIPMSEILKRSNELNTEIPCIIYCRIGRRSAKVVSVLEMHRKMNNLYNLVGGTNEWSKEIDPSMEIY
jgi:rhodanese-related sulfurtransferase